MGQRRGRSIVARRDEPSGAGPRVALIGAALALALLAVGCPQPEVPAEGQSAAPSLLTVGLHVIWFDGGGDDDRAEIDRFLECLVDGSNLHDFWNAGVSLVRRGSVALPRPAARLDYRDLGAWLTAEVEAGRLEGPRAGETPLYLVIGGAPDLWVGACGRNAEGRVADVRAGIGAIRNTPLCWPTGDRLRTETQILAHELVETVDRLLGFGACAGGGACRGRAVCEGHCETFVGLECPGAPKASWTGCDGGRVDGWVVQKFSRAGRDPSRCDACAECDFTPRACRPGEAHCGRPRTVTWR